MNKLLAGKMMRFSGSRAGGLEKIVSLLHPFLLALYPTLFLYAYNINYFKESVLVIPLLISLISTGIILLINWLIFRKLTVAAIITSLFVFFFFSYGRIKEPVKNIGFNLGNVFISPDKILFAVILTLFGFIIFWLVSGKRDLTKINKAISIFSLFLVIMAVCNTVSFEIKRGRIQLSNLGKDASQFSDPRSTQTPDIYYFILDRYDGDPTLKDYGFDNSSFINFLKSKGFYIASNSTSNYPKTFLSLASTLNMEYLDFLTLATNGGASADESIVTPLIQNNKVIQFLKSRGYSYIHVGSGWNPTRFNPYADRNFVMSGGRYPFADEFTNGLLQTTIAAPILKKIYPDRTAISQDPKNNEFRSRILYEFSVFDQIPKMAEPKFVFAHILIPHDPYVLGKDCEPLVEGTVVSRPNVENYVNQLQCANKKTEETIEKILADSKQMPIIIIQADEGQMPIKNPIPPNLAWGQASDASIREKFPILNAYLLPNQETNSLYLSITPVNSFRILFNSYFGTDYSLLPDKNIIFEDGNNLYKFIDVTKRVKNLLK